MDAFQCIDDFEKGNLSAWDVSVGPEFVAVGPDPTDPGNQCMIISAGETRMRIPWGLPEGETETLYYRFMYETVAEGGTVNLHVGATDPVDTAWGDYYGLSRFSSYHDSANVPDMDVRDGGAYSDLIYMDFEPLRWYQVVLEYDTAAKTYDVYIDAELVFNDAAFRSGYSPTNLEYIMIRTTTWQGNFANGTVYVDDITVGATPGFAQAASPNPKNGATLDGTWASLSWRPGDSAVSSDLYVGTSFDDVNDGAAHTFVGNITESLQLIGFPGYPFPDGLQPGTTYYWRVDGINEADPESPWKGNIWSFWVPSKAAHNPIPVDGMKFIDTDAALKWSPGENAALHTIYFGTSADEVANATSGGTNQGATTFDPGPLESETTYYWRVDEHAGLVETKGPVWSFTTEREGGGLRGDYYDIGGGTPQPPDSAFSGQPVMTRIDPGINFEGPGGTSPEPNVVSENAFAVLWTGEIEIPLTARYTFIPRAADGVVFWIDGVEHVNQWRGQPPESMPGRPLELEAGDIVAIELWYHQGGGDWAVRLDWVSDKFERQPVPAAACSPPLRASRSEPANNAVDITRVPQLSWSAGQDAAEHDVYFGTDADAVAAADPTTADIYKGRQAETSFAPAQLELNTTYYWRVDEVNDTHPDSPWKGAVWSFTTADFIIIDDFESYDAYDQIWWSWNDGLGYVAHDDEPAYAGNGTGSAVGDETTASYTEEGNPHGGSQAMPFFYDNNKQGVAKYSEVEMTLTVSRNWTEEGVGELSLWFHGDPANSAERLYVAASNTAGQPAVVYHDDPIATQTDAWTQWVIPLQTFGDQGIELINVDKIALGVGTRGNMTVPGGAGKMLFDDIRLGR
ncbi:MAG: PA14 domain-containing protein [Planctomycetota bacterium]